MNYEEMIALVNEINTAQAIRMEEIPHGSNLLFQLEKRDTRKKDFFEHILPLYLETRNVPFDENHINNFILSVVQKYNRYMDCFWPPANNPFSHQTDFTSSIIPEMLCNIFRNIIIHSGEELEVSAQKNLTIECTFDISEGGRICFKNKRVDVAVVRPCELRLNEYVAELPIPLLAIECKTNLDKNMLSGIEHSVTELKKTFPTCSYFVATECSDFDVFRANYASSEIDEMFILRKQKRAVLRRQPNLRNPIDAHLVLDLANTLIDKIAFMNTVPEILSTRMQNGKLIGRN